MAKIRLLSTVSAASKASHHILVSCQEVGLSCATGHHGQLSLIAVSTCDGDVYMFDVKGNRDVLFDGGVARILQSPDLVKVIHKCLDSIRALHLQHGILTQNVFDTQLAFSAVLETEGLPARRLPLSALCEKNCIPQYQPSPQLQTLLKEDADVWMRRPFTADLLNTMASTVMPLHPLLYKKLKRILHTRREFERYEKLITEEIQRAILRRKVRTQQHQGGDNDRETISPYRNKQGRLTTQQRLLLSGMTPVIIQDIKK